MERHSQKFWWLVLTAAIGVFLQPNRSWALSMIHQTLSEVVANASEINPSTQKRKSEPVLLEYLRTQKDDNQITMDHVFMVKQFLDPAGDSDLRILREGDLISVGNFVQNPYLGEVLDHERAGNLFVGFLAYNPSRNNYIILSTMLSPVDPVIKSNGRPGFVLRKDLWEMSPRNQQHKLAMWVPEIAKPRQPFLKGAGEPVEEFIQRIKSR